MVASKILLLLSSAYATIGGEQVITQTKCKLDKFNHATVIDYVCKFYYLYSTVAESSNLAT